jgi:hypothetical protein
MLKQITVFLENRSGRIEEVTACLAEHNINIHALSIADTTEFGILRMIVSDPGGAAGVLKENSFMAMTTDVIAVAMGRKPGSLNKVLKEIKPLGVSIEYMYAFSSRHKDHDAILIMSLSDQDAAIEKLRKSDFPLLEGDILEELD